MHRVYTGDEYAELFVEGKAPSAPITIVRKYYKQLPEHIVKELLETQDIVVLPDANYQLVRG